MKSFQTSLLAAALLASTAVASAQVFDETFDSAAASSNFNELAAYNVDEATNPPTITYGYDYSSAQNSGGTTITVPEAPNTPGGAPAQSGLFVQVNTSSGGAQNATNVQFYPDISPLGDDQSITFDAFFLIGSPGTTEYLHAGIFHAGDKVINVFQDELDGFPENPFATDGYFFVINGDGGASTFDLHLMEGDPAAQDTFDGETAPGTDFTWEITGASTTESKTGVEGTSFQTALDDSGNFASNTGLPGPNEGWITFRISANAGVVTWEADIHDGNGFILIATYDDPTDTYSSGIPGFSYGDPFGSSRNDDTAIIIDNLVIDGTATSVSDWALY